MFNKKGFTLTEVLVTLSIIGVVAALCLPAIRHIMPNKTKAAYMKAYNALAVLTDEILGDPSLYWTTYSSGSANCAGLYCNAQPTITPYSSNSKYSGTTKYPMLLSSKMHLLDTPSVSDSKVTFDTIDGTEWVFATSTESNSTAYLGGKGYVTTLTLDVGDQQFTFTIDNDGGITPEDTLGKAFLKNAANLTSQES